MLQPRLDSSERIACLCKKRLHGQNFNELKVNSLYFKDIGIDFKFHSNISFLNYSLSASPAFPLSEVNIFHYFLPCLQLLVQRLFMVQLLYQS